MEIIKIDDVSKGYDAHQVHENLSLSIKKGECFTLLGPSGCGKTVLLRLIAGFELPDKGRISIDGTLVTDPANNVYVSPDQRGLGVVFQDYAVWPHMSVFDNVAYPLKIAKRSKDEINQRVMHTLEMVGMKNLEKRMPSELSGGQQQRVAIARAVVANPKLILADEPTGNLDSKNGKEVMELLTELNKEGTTIVMVTHSQHDSGYAGRTINLFDGQVVNEIKI